MNKGNGKTEDSVDLGSLGPRSSGRRSYDQYPWYAKIISTSGIAGLIAVMLIVNQQRTAELDKKLSSSSTDKLAVAIDGLHEAIDQQAKSINELRTQVQLLQEALRVQATQPRLSKPHKTDKLSWEANAQDPIQP